VAAGASKYIGAFTNVVVFDLAEATPPGTGGQYGRALPIPVVVKPLRDSSSTPVCVAG
jgi:hypothetical protein